jgi:hypothetical protein
VIAAYGQRYFKLKVAGSVDADIHRLAGIAAVLDRMPEPYFTTLDGNEQFEHVDAVIALWRRIDAEQRLARLKASILFIEQPIARTKALAEPIHALAHEIPVEIDESDADIGVFPAARALGYRGISAKSCKGFYRALLNRARVARWNANGGPTPFFMSCEDLITQAGIAVQQDLALATLVGATMWSATGTTMWTVWRARRNGNSSSSCPLILNSINTPTAGSGSPSGRACSCSARSPARRDWRSA